jgi:TP901 family phage tail tape measure protein
MATIGSLVVKIGADIAGLEAGLDTAAGKLKGFGKSSAQLGGALTAGVTLPLVGLGVMALNSAGDFETGMNVLQSITGATAKDMEAMSATALLLGADTSFSAGEAAEAMLELGKAGLAPRDIIASMPGVLSLAAAGNLDVATAAGIAANAVNTFGLAAGETTNVANMLAAAANASSADVSDLAQGFTMAGSVFASNGQSMSDLTTAMALMSNAGIAGSDAGTSLKTMLMRLAAPTGEAAAVLDELGLNVYNADGSMRSFEAIVGDLSTATKGLTDIQRNAALSTIFGADAIRAANVLVAEGAQGFSDMEAAVTKAGAAEEAAAARMKGFNGALEGLKGSFDSLLIKIGTPLLNSLTGVVQKLTEMTNAFTALDPGMQQTILVILGIVAAIGPVLIAIGAMASGLGALMSAAGLIMPILGALGAAIAAIGWPITLVIAAIAALAVAWQTNFLGIQDITAAAWAWLQEAFATGVANIQVYLDLFMAGVGALGEMVQTAFASIQLAVQTAQTIWTNVMDAMATAVQPVMDAIGVLKEAIASFQEWLNGMSMPNPFAGLDVPVPQSNFALPPGGIALPQLPGFAEGTSNYPGGWGIVGEEGPELVKLPRGSEILPADASAAMGGGVTVYANVNGKVDVEELAQRVLDVLRRRGR